MLCFSSALSYPAMRATICTGAENPAGINTTRTVSPSYTSTTFPTHTCLSRVKSLPRDACSSQYGNADADCDDAKQAPIVLLFVGEICEGRKGCLFFTCRKL